MKPLMRIGFIVEAKFQTNAISSQSSLSQIPHFPIKSGSYSHFFFLLGRDADRRPRLKRSDEKKKTAGPSISNWNPQDDNVTT